jgi:hypothetical protein
MEFGFLAYISPAGVLVDFKHMHGVRRGVSLSCFGMLVDLALVLGNNALPCPVCTTNPAWGLWNISCQLTQESEAVHEALIMLLMKISSLPSALRRWREEGNHKSAMMRCSPSQELRRAAMTAFTTSSSPGILMVRQRDGVAVVWEDERGSLAAYVGSEAAWRHCGMESGREPFLYRRPCIYRLGAEEVARRFGALSGSIFAR